LLLLLLQGMTEAKTAAALQELVEEASRYAPCILILRHFEVLANEPGEAG
jgi:hypothetical protein